MTKEQERNELHKTIWAIANDLRGSVDGWDFKQYVLGALFYRFISENFTDYINQRQHEANKKDFDYQNLDDQTAEKVRARMVDTKGFFIRPSELFANVVKNANNDEQLNITLETIFHNIEESANGKKSEDNLKGLFADFDVNNRKLGDTVEKRNKQLAKLLNKIAGLNLGNYQDNTIDLFGDAYEYLMGMYASQAGKSGGEYFTPQEVSELLARLTVVGRDHVNKVYDPACGSGSLLLKFAKVLGKENIKFYGQEINLTTYNLCRINMFLHDINYINFNIQRGDTLIDPKHKQQQPFDAIVSNPPYSIKWEGDANPILINDPRFAPAGVLAPKSKADLAFTMHMLSWLDSKGTCAIVEFPGVLYRSGKEQKIRQYMIDNNYVDCVIQLPADLFFGVTIATCILVLKKNKKDNSILFIDASNEFVRLDTKNKLTDAHIKKILDAYTERKTIENFTYLASNDEVAKNDFNLTVSKYVSKPDTTEVIDIHQLNTKIKEVVKKQEELRASLEEIIQQLEKE